MKTNITLADRAVRLLNEPAGHVAAALDARATGGPAPTQRSAMDHVSQFVGLDVQLAATAKPSNAAVRHNHFRAAILSLQGAEACLTGLASKMGAYPSIPLTETDLRNIGPKMRAAAEALEAAAGDGTHPRDAVALYQAIGAFLSAVAANAEELGVHLGHKAELAKLEHPESRAAEAMAYWQDVTQGDARLAKELSSSLAEFYASAERVLTASSKLLRGADDATTLMQPVSISFAEHGFWVDAAWNPKTSRLELSVGGHPVAYTWCSGDQIGELMYNAQLPRFARGFREQELRARLLEEQINRNGACGADLEKAFDKRFSSQAAIDKAAKAARSTFAPIKLSLPSEPRRHDQVATPVNVVWDPLWGALRVGAEEYDLRHPGVKDVWLPSLSGVSPETLKDALNAALAERPGDTSPKALERARVACGIASPE